MRGHTSEVGEERITQNGYKQVRTPESWRYLHHIVAEEKLGRSIDGEHERVVFLDKNRLNCDPDNLEVRSKKKFTDPNLEAAYLEDEIAKLQARLEELNAGQEVPIDQAP